MSRADAPAASPLPRRIRAAFVAEIVQSLRRGEGVLVSLGLPLLVLVFLARVDVLGDLDRPVVDHVAPLVLVLALIGGAFVAPSITIAFDRKHGVLARLAATPLGRPALVASKALAVLASVFVQTVVLSIAAFALGWAGPDGPAVLALSLLAGTAAFATLGVALAGMFSAELTLALANALYVILILFGGVAVPLDRLPGLLALAASVLPSAALVEAATAASWTGAVDSGALVTLVVWTAIGALLAARTFRWE